MDNEVFRLDEYLLKTYGYTFTDFNDLAKQDFVEFEGIGANSLFWITINGQKYLFKKIESGFGEYTWIGELLSKKIADLLGIPCAEYTICRLNDCYGILSKKFTLENETLILGAQIIQEVLNKYPYLKDKTKTVLDDEDFINLYNVPDAIIKMPLEYKFEYLHNNLNNLEQLWSIIEMYLNIHNLDIDYQRPIMEYLTQLFMFDVLTLQTDRHMGNWSIILIKNKDGSLSLRTSDVFDNATSFNLWRYGERRSKFYGVLDSIVNYPDNKKAKEGFTNFLYLDKLLLTPSEDAIRNAKKKKREPATKLVEYFLKVSDSTYVNLFNEYFQKVKNADILGLLEEIEQEQHIEIPEDAKEYICDVMKYNILLIEESINKVLKESGRGLDV